MQGWQTSYLGLRDMPSEISEFELQAFFSFSRADLELIARRRSDNLKLGLALHIGFARMTGLPLNSVSAVPPALLRHLGRELEIAAPDLASLRAVCPRTHPVRPPAPGMRMPGIQMDDRAPAPRPGASAPRRSRALLGPREAVGTCQAVAIRSSTADRARPRDPRHGCSRPVRTRSVDWRGRRGHGPCRDPQTLGSGIEHASPRRADRNPNTSGRSQALCSNRASPLTV